MKLKCGLFFLSIIVSFSVISAQDPVIAKVGGITVTQTEFMKSYAQNLLTVTNKPVTKESVLNQLINKKLGVAKARKDKLQNNPIVKEKLDDVLFNAQVSKDLEEQMKALEVSDSEVKKYYKQFPEYRTAHILFRIRAQPSENEWKAAQEQALRVYKTLQSKPDKFFEFANKFSQTSNAPTGGDLGFQPAKALAPEYFKAIKGKKVGHITSPVRTQFGYHIIRVAAVKDYKEINPVLYKKIVFDQKRDKVMEGYYQNLRKGKNVQIDKDLLSKITLGPKK